MTDQEIRDSVYFDQWKSSGAVTPSRSYKVLKVKDGENLSGGWVLCDCSVIVKAELKITEDLKTRKQPIVITEIADGKQIDYVQLVKVSDIRYYQECDVVRNDFPRRMFCSGSLGVCRAMQCRMKPRIQSMIRSVSVKSLTEWNFDRVLNHIREDLKWIIEIEHGGLAT